MWHKPTNRAAMAPAGETAGSTLVGYGLGLLLLCLLIACDPTSSTPLRVATLPWPGYESLHLAQSLGYLPAEDIRLVELVNTTQVAAALRNGAVAVGLVTLDSALTLMQQGVDLRVILVMDISVGADAVLARPEITDLHQLRGKRVAVENAMVGGVMLDAALTEVGLNANDIQLMALTVNEHAAAYRRGDVDAIVTFEPVPTQLRQEGVNVLFDSRKIPGRIVDVMVVREGIAERYERQLMGLVNAHFRALLYLQQFPLDAHGRIAPYLGVSAEQVPMSMAGISIPSLADNHRLLNGKSPELSRMANDLADYMRERKLLHREFPVNRLPMANFLPPSNHFLTLSSQQANP